MRGAPISESNSTVIMLVRVAIAGMSFIHAPNCCTGDEDSARQVGQVLFPSWIRAETQCSTVVCDFGWREIFLLATSGSTDCQLK